jgi:hypothetical protein
MEDQEKGKKCLFRKTVFQHRERVVLLSKLENKHEKDFGNSGHVESQ